MLHHLLAGLRSGLGVRRGRRRQERSQLGVPGDLRAAEGAERLLLQPGVLQEAGGAQGSSPEEHG